MRVFLKSLSVIFINIIGIGISSVIYAQDDVKNNDSNIESKCVSECIECASVSNDNLDVNSYEKRFCGNNLQAYCSKVYKTNSNDMLLCYGNGQKSIAKTDVKRILISCHPYQNA